MLRRTAVRSWMAGMLLSPVIGQELEARQVRDEVEPGSELRISLVTMGPGPDVWERFGHNAIWVEDTLRGTSRWYNYGMFSFAEPGYILRFIRARLRYWLATNTPGPSLQAYRARGRSVWVQDLALSPAVRDSLRNFLEWNDTDANRFYSYDYYLDNCSTRIRDAIDMVLGSQIRRQTVERFTDRTFRFHTQRLTTNTPLLYTGLLIGLGPRVDRPVTVWDEMFLPMSVREHFRDLTVTHDDGTTEPLVHSETTLFESDAWPTDDAPPRWTPIYLLIGVAIGAALAALGRAAPNRRGARVGFAALGTVWALVVGFLGTVLLGLWVATDHAFSYWNENLFLFNPFSLALGLVLPVVAMRARWAVRPAEFLSWAVGGLSLLGFLLQALPGVDQVNGQLYALVLIPNGVLTLALLRMVGRESGAASRES